MLEIADLYIRYGAVEAVHGISFAVAQLRRTRRLQKIGAADVA